MIQVENTQVVCQTRVILYIIVVLFKDVEKTKNRINNNTSGAVGGVCD